ncbi:MAG: thiol-disulfide oxidoreductase [Bacteroidetes bacterium MedPE-SWsnd-G2]|nr:MAG: thiol-disulfide oxidoreductase [Bacteroidetes bacterium MedPE-SWsnd-G2]
MSVLTESKIIFFDGVCNLCNTSVQYVIRHDSDNVFKFAPLQSELAKELLSPYGVNVSELNSIVYYDSGIAVYENSDAAIKIASQLDGAVSMLKYFWWIPRFLRDPIYKFIAKNRYRWFGKKDACMIPTPAMKSKFIA